MTRDGTVDRSDATERSLPLSSGHRSRSNDEASVRGLHQGQQSIQAASTGRTHDCKRPLCCTPKDLLPGGGHPHMKRREFITLLGGAAAAWPLAASAQQPAMPVIGFLNSQSRQAWRHLTESFLQGLSEAGYVEGRNVAIEYRFAERQFDQLPALAADLVRHGVAVIVTSGGDAPARAAKAATDAIPIVFIVGGDPVATGFVESLARPGGNATGVTLFTATLELKRLEFLREMVPALSTLALLANPDNPRFADDIKNVREAAQLMAVVVQALTARNGNEMDTAFAALARRRVDGLLVMSDPVLFSERDRLVALAARHSIPAIYQNREMAAAGGLMSYGTAVSAVYHRLGAMAGRVLKGGKPADIPVEQPTKYELVINLKTAQALGLDLPPTLLARADEVIE
jgi:putative tryptophan/tyrosine transport system substrate-binding protein